LVVSFSADSQHTAAGCLHPNLASDKTNQHCFSLDKEKKLFGERVTYSRKNLMKLFSENDKTSVLTALQAFPSDSALNLRYDARGLVTVGFEDAKGAIQSTTYDLHVDQDLQFLSELQTAYTLGRTLSSSSAQGLVQDDVPDSYAITFSTYTGLIEKYGRSSAEAAAGLHILDNAVPMLLETFSNLYPDRLLAQVVLMGSHPSTKASVDRRNLFAEVQKLVPTVKNIAETFPVVYLQAGSESAHICKSVSMHIKDPSYQVFCPASQLVSALFNANERNQHSFVDKQDSSVKTNAAVLTATTENSEDVEVYQIVLWLSIIMFFVTLAAAYSLAGMSFKRDPLLYSTFNPKWENRKNK